MITSANGSEDIKKALSLGCLDYLEKIDYIKENIIYGNIGRPQYVYKKM